MLNAASAVSPLCFVLATTVASAISQELPAVREQAGTEVVEPPERVEVEPLANDSQIENRLVRILQATTWFVAPQVDVDEGVVFLTGQTLKEEHRVWAGDLARNTGDVVAVVNRIRVVERPFWDVSPAWNELQLLARQAVQMSPLLLVGLLLVLVTYLVAIWSIVLSRRLLVRRIQNHLLIGVISKALSVPVFLMGLYLVLRVTGLTQMAATVLGGTGLIGLVLGIAFRDIAENFLASVLLSIQRPFALGDLIEVEGRVGIVQSLTTRGTLLMTPDGNHVQIPNASIYRSIIINLSSNPNVRIDFAFQVDYRDTVADAQAMILELLKGHRAVLTDPEPMVLAEDLSATSATVRAYFWVNDRETSAMKVKSSVIRMVRAALQQAGMHVPTSTHELLFPVAVPHVQLDVQQFTDMPRDGFLLRDGDGQGQGIRPDGDSQVEVDSERGFKSDRAALEQQAQQARSPEPGPNLLAGR